MKQYVRLASAFVIASILIAATARMQSMERVSAQVFDGPGLEYGVELADSISDLPNNNNPRRVIVDVLEAALNFASLLAVIMIIIAGFYLILSLGDDEKRDKAKKIIFYTLIGLVVLLLARVIVGIVTVYLAESID